MLFFQCTVPTGFWDTAGTCRRGTFVHGGAFVHLLAGPIVHLTPPPTSWQYILHTLTVARTVAQAPGPVDRARRVASSLLCGMSGLVDFGTLTTFARVFGSILANVGCESTVTRTGAIVPWISVYFVHFAATSRRGR